MQNNNKIIKNFSNIHNYYSNIITFKCNNNNNYIVDQGGGDGGHGTKHEPAINTTSSLTTGSFFNCLIGIIRRFRTQFTVCLKINLKTFSLSFSISSAVD